MARLAVCLTSALVTASGAGAATSRSDCSLDGLWRDVDEATIDASQERLIVPLRYRTVAVDEAALDRTLAAAPLEGSTESLAIETVMTLPMPDGGCDRFRVLEAPIMAPGLAARFPDIGTYRAVGIDDPFASARLDRTPQGFHGTILAPGGTVYIDPYARGNTGQYVVYDKRDYAAERPSEWVCRFGEPPSTRGRDLAKPAPGEASGSVSRMVPSGSQLRTYRIAVAATGEYTQFHGGTKADGQAAIVTAMNRVNGLYERDVSLRMILVADNDLVVYTNPATDPYTNSSGSFMLGQNQTNLDAVIGSANYDIGHVFSTGGGGIASLGVPCVDGAKARGVTGLGSPVGDPFWVDYVAHELGHQWGANHTFNGNEGACSGGNRNAATAYEPGSGTTIMAYAGICGSQNIQPNSDDHFHGISIDEIVAYSTTSSGDSCADTTASGNTPPTVDAGLDHTIPRTTPFELCGQATDPDHSGLTYGWEEFDLGPAGAPDSPVGDAPIFRSFTPEADGCRVFPQLSDLLDNTQTLGEILPGYARSLNFRLTVRDNFPGGGGVDSDVAVITVDGASGPFLVTSPNTAVSWTGDDSETVSWDPAGTIGFCPEVDILFSADGGVTFPVTVLAATPNDGTQSILVPDTDTTAARLMVLCSSSVFFDLSDVDFTVTAVVNNPPTVTITTPADSAIFEITDVVSFTGSADDLEDGSLTGDLAWASDIDGPIGAGGTPSTMLSAGYHTVTAVVTDSMGETGSDVVGLIIQDTAGGCPADLAVTVDPPAGASTYKAAGEVTLDGVAISAAADVTVKAGRSIAIDNGTTIEGLLTALTTPTGCD